MPALNHSAFPQLVEFGSKLCSIRAKRRQPIKVGDVLKHYTGMRTKKCRLLRTSKVTQVTDILITRGYVRLSGNMWIDTESIDKLARMDGFEKTAHFYAYFVGDCLEFHGDLIMWENESLSKKTSKKGGKS